MIAFYYYTQYFNYCFKVNFQIKTIIQVEIFVVGNGLKKS